MFSSYGPIAKPSDDQKDGWYYVKADDSIGDYYKWFASRGLLQPWQPCMNGCHITFVAGEKDERIVSVAEIQPYVGKDIQFYYTNQIWTNTQAFWLPVLSPQLDEVRVALGLKPRFLYHVTLGNCKNQSLK